MTEKQLVYLAIEEFHYKGRTEDQIAKILHLPLDYVKQQLEVIRFHYLSRGV
jgi:hypothetical protein